LVLYANTWNLEGGGRNKASTLGVNASQIESALRYAYGSGQVSLIYTPTNQFQVILELILQYRRDVNALSLLYVRSNSGNMVPLSAIAHLSQNVGSLTVSHLGQTSATISYNLAPGTSLEQANAAITKLATTILPATIPTSRCAE
jgi:HAE1 family hydrophobic/amphiphilic exporter-1